MTGKSQDETKELQSQTAGEPSGNQLDAAGKSLSEALRISFIALKVIMFALVLFFLASGLRKVESGEVALVLRFGEIHGEADKRILKPGPHWVLPYPIEEIVRIPVERTVNLAVDSFWYAETEAERLAAAAGKKFRIKQSLNPVKDGYCITRSARGSEIASAGSDYNIIHCKWQLTYKIRDPEPFFRNIFVREIKPGESHTDVIDESINPLLKDLVEDSVVTAIVNYTIDQVKFEEVAKVTIHIRRLLQDKLDEIGSGIEVVSMQLTRSTWPRQVDQAFQASVAAGQASQQLKREASTEAQKILSVTGGPVAEELLAALKDETVSEADKEQLWSQLAGDAREIIGQAKAYRQRVVANAEANAQYLHTLLPEYRKRPELVLKEIYLSAMEEIFANADEKFVIQRSEDAKATEIRVLINRDPSLKSKSGKSGNSETEEKK